MYEYKSELECVSESELFIYEQLRSIAWFNLKNAFGSLPHTSLFKLCNTQQITDKINIDHKDIYTNSIHYYF